MVQFAAESTLRIPTDERKGLEVRREKSTTSYSTLATRSAYGDCICFNSVQSCCSPEQRTDNQIARENLHYFVSYRMFLGPSRFAFPSPVQLGPFTLSNPARHLHPKLNLPLLFARCHRCCGNVMFCLANVCFCIKHCRDNRWSVQTHASLQCLLLHKLCHYSASHPLPLHCGMIGLFLLPSASSRQKPVQKCKLLPDCRDCCAVTRRVTSKMQSKPLEYNRATISPFPSSPSIIIDHTSSSLT